MGVWNGKHFSTDYAGAHHKQYEKDVASGKAAAWEAKYPNFTNPELRKAKQEELDTFGKSFDLYDRFYKDEEPNIDELYKNFK